MRHGWRIAAVVGSIVAVGGLALVLRTLNAAGVFSDVTPAFDGSCRTIRGVVGAEDMAIDRRTGLAFISATDRRAPKERPSAQDGLYLFDLAHPGRGVSRIAGTPKDFHPHGIDLIRAPDGSLTLMAVNHRADGSSTIDIFAVTESKDADGTPSVTVRERTSVRSSLIFSPNDVAAVGPNRFYVTNDHASRTEFGRMLEIYLLLPRANVVYYNGEVPRVVADGLRYANGIALSRDKSRLYVAETLGREIRTYDVQPVSGSLRLKSAYPLPAGLDNIDVDPAGNLWVAGHPKLFAFTKYVTDAAHPSPSEVFEVTTAAGIPRGFKLVYTGLGKRIGASSVGVADGHTLLIGSVFDPKFVDCTMTAASAPTAERAAGTGGPPAAAPGPHAH